MIPGFRDRKRFSDLTEPRDPGARHLVGRGGQPRLRDLCGAAARRNIRKAPKVFDGDGRGGGHASPPPDREPSAAASARPSPSIRREHVTGFYHRRPYWLVGNLGIERVREEIGLMEEEARSFYLKAAQRTARRGDAQAARRPCGGGGRARRRRRRGSNASSCRNSARAEEEAVAHRQFVLTYVQPGLAGLMDGSVSTLAPVFAAAFATHDPWQTLARRLRRIDRRRHLDGLHRGALRRRGADRPRLAAASAASPAA